MSAAHDAVHGLRARQPDAQPVIPAPPRHWKSRILLPAGILLVMLALLALTSARTLWPATAVRVVPVVSKTVEGTSVVATVQAPGWLEPDPHPYYVAALADGVVEEVLLLEGERVERGQIVATLVDEDARLALRRATAELDQRRARKLAAEAGLTAARLELENLIDRTNAVTVGEAAVAETQAELQRVQADLAVERARLLEIQDELDRKTQLADSAAVSEATVARLRLQLDGQRAVLEATSARRAVGEARLRRAAADLDAARTRRRLLIEERRAVELAEADVQGASAAVALAEASRDEAALRLARMEVRSPVHGIVMQRLAAPGTKLTTDGPAHSAHVAHVYDPLHLQVRVDVPLADAAQVSVGQRREIAVEVLPEHVFTGGISRIVHEADIQKNTVEVKVAIDDPTSELKPEMLARVRFLGDEGPDVTRERVFAPRSVMRQGDAGVTVAYVVTGLSGARGRVERREVTPGSRELDGWVEIEHGLLPGDLLVANPSPGLEAGDRVRVVGEDAGGEVMR